MKQTWRFRLRAAGVHLACSAIIAGCVFGVLYGLWYPPPLFSVAGGKSLFLLLVSCDVLLGPILTLIVFNVSKRRSQLFRDVGLIVLVQISALLYGTHTMYVARPVYIVYNVGQFNAVQDSMLDRSAYQKMPRSVPGVSWSGPKWIGAILPADNDERTAVMFSSAFGGPDIYQMPQYFVPYNRVKTEIANHTMTPKEFVRRYGGDLTSLQAILAKHSTPGINYGLMPIVLREGYAVATIDKATGEAIAMDAPAVQ